MLLAAVGILLVPYNSGHSQGPDQGDARHIGVGRPPSAAEVAAWDVAIGPAGKELPPGQGTAIQGADLFLEKCASCHSENGREGPDDVLVGGQGSLATAKPLQTVGSFWPYATTSRVPCRFGNQGLSAQTTYMP